MANIKNGDDNPNKIDGSPDDDVISGFGGNDELRGENGNDEVIGGTGDDYLTGDAGNDRILGEDGNDDLFGGGGDDTLIGGEHNSPGAGTDFVDATFGSDDNWEWLDYAVDDEGSFGLISNLSPNDITTGGVFVAAGTVRDNYGDTDTIVSIEGVMGTHRDDIFYTKTTQGRFSEEWNAVVGYRGNDFIDGSAGMAQIRYEQEWEYGGTLGIIANLSSVTKVGVAARHIRDTFGDLDTVVSVEVVGGTLFADKIFGGNGKNEVFEGFKGNDYIDGGAKHDVARYNADDQVVDWVGMPGELPGNKAIYVNLSGAGKLLGGKFVSAHSAFDGFGTKDTLLNIEEVWGTVKNDAMLAAKSGSSFWGNKGKDTLTGNTGKDHLWGGEGKDTLIGNAGADELEGGAGKDLISGGAGADRFQYQSASGGGDKISDFDKSDVFAFASASFQNLALGKLQASMFRARADNRAVDADDHFIFRTTDDTLWYDANGNAAGGRTLIADLDISFTLAAGDILII